MLWSEEDERWEETEVRGVGRARRDDVWEPKKNVSKRRDCQVLHKETVRGELKGSTGFTKQEVFRFLNKAFFQEGSPDGHQIAMG